MKPSKRALPLAPPTRYTPAILEGIADGERAALGPLLARRDEPAAIEAAAQALARAEALAEASMATEPPGARVNVSRDAAFAGPSDVGRDAAFAGPSIACRAGCAACCVSKVLVLAPEVLRIARHLRDTLDEAALAALLERVRAADARTRGLSRQERAVAAVPCPLLDEGGACSVHAARPLVCAGWTSIDVTACHRHFNAPGDVPAAPMHPPTYEIANAVLAGLGWAAKEQGLDAAPLELIAALRIALERPNAGARWLRGLAVFALARDPEWQEQHGLRPPA